MDDVMAFIAGKHINTYSPCAEFDYKSAKIFTYTFCIY